MNQAAQARPQPGLEVHYDPTPESIDGRSSTWNSPSQNGTSHDNQNSEQKIVNTHGYGGLGYQHGYGGGAYGNGYDAEATHHAAEEPKPARRIPLVLIGLGALLVFVLAGVVGGVAGWRITANQNQQKEEAVPGSVGGGGGGTTPSTSATEILQNSALTAVGWRYGTDITLQVWFQGPDTALRRSEYKSIYQNWTSPLEVDAAPKAGSPFSASQFWNKPDPLPVFPQAELFYIGIPNKIQGANWRDGFSRGGLSDSINDGQWTTDNTGTQIASYWPSNILQAASGDLMEVWFDYKSPRFQEPKTVGVTASPGSALVILPREVIHSAGEGTTASSVRIIYRGIDGRLNNYDRSSGGQKLTSSGQLPVTVDSNFTMAGFAVARLDTSGKSTALNTWILYQDSKTGKISYVYEDDTTGWKDPETDPVFDDADKVTHIACVTASSSKVPEVPLEASHDLSHCFFQANKKLKHVHFDGSTWTDMGFIPIP